MIALKKIFLPTLLMIFFTLSNSGCTSSLAPQGTQYVNPAWAPAYYPGVRYYYFPDIEVYYDLSNQDFVYLNDGQWLFSYDLPPIYSGFDLYGAYIVALDVDVFQPWMHHQFYVANYPRYYYRSLYRNYETENIRGFNENEHKEIYWTQEERNRINDLRRNVSTERRSENIERRTENTERRAENLERRTESNERRTESSRPPQRSNYYGTHIGRAVKVLPQMRENRSEGHERRK